MWFDAKAALREIENQHLTPATSATSATRGGENEVPCSNVADVAAPESQNPQIGQLPDLAVLEAIALGNVRPGPIATHTNLGATVTYQLLDKLIALGRIHQARDGVLSVVSSE